MKAKLIIASIILFLGAAIFVGCNKLNNNFDKNSRESKEAIIQKFEKIGEIHTKGLEYAFSFLKNRKFISKNDLLESTQNAEIKYLQSLMDPTFGSNIRDAYLQETKRLSNSVAIFKSAPISFDEYFLNTINNSVLSDTTKAFLKNIGTILDNNSDLDKINIALNSNYSKAYNVIKNKSEIYVVAIATIVAKSSTAYWKKNLQNWLKYSSLSKKNKSMLSTQSIFSGVGKADVAGAIGGAVGSLVSGCGELTLGACTAAGAAGGGVASSVGAFLENIL